MKNLLANHMLTVLVVEDEALLRMDAADFITDFGCHVFEAANADEALRQLESDAGIDVLFTDIDMPGSMDGMGLARCVHERWPGIQILTTSGYRRLTSDDLPEHSLFIPKPYPPSEVTNAIRQVTTV